MGSGAGVLPRSMRLNVNSGVLQWRPSCPLPPPTLGAWPPACHKEQVSSAWAWNSSASSICFRRCSRDFSNLPYREVSPE